MLLVLRAQPVPPGLLALLVQLVRKAMLVLPAQREILEQLALMERRVRPVHRELMAMMVSPAQLVRRGRKVTLVRKELRGLLGWMALVCPVHPLLAQKGTLVTQVLRVRKVNRASLETLALLDHADCLAFRVFRDPPVRRDPLDLLVRMVRREILAILGRKEILVPLQQGVILEQTAHQALMA